MTFTDPQFRYPSTIYDAAHHQTDFTYDPATGQVLASLDVGNHLATSWSYDGFGRKTRVNRPDSTATTWAYRRCVDTCGYGGTAKSVTITQNWAMFAGRPTSRRPCRWRPSSTRTGARS